MNHPSLRLLPLLLAPLLAAQEGEKIALKVTAKKGDTAWFVQKVKMEQAIDMGGQQMDMGNETTHIFSITVSDIDEQGGLTVETRVARIKGSMTLPMMGDMEFDSAEPAKAEDEGDETPGMPNPGAVGKAMTSMAGKTFVAKVKSDGQVTDMKGVEEALAEARKKAGPLGGQMLGGSLNSGMIERMIEGAFGNLPTEPVAVGAVWERKGTDRAARLNVQTNTKMSLTKVDAKQVEIKIDGTVAKAAQDAKRAAGKQAEEDPDAAMQKEMFAKMKIENGKMTGSQLISRKDGFVVKSQNIMSMDITVPSPMGGEMTISQKTTQNIDRTTAEAATAKLPAKKTETGEKKGDAGKD